MFVRFTMFSWVPPSISSQKISSFIESYYFFLKNAFRTYCVSLPQKIIEIGSLAKKFFFFAEPAQENGQTHSKSHFP